MIAQESIPNVALYTLEAEEYPIAITYHEGNFVWKDYVSSVGLDYMYKELTEETDIRTLRLAKKLSVLQPLYEAIEEASAFGGSDISATTLYNAFEEQLQECIALYTEYNSAEAMANTDLLQLATQIDNSVQRLKAHTKTVEAVQSAGSIEEELVAALNAFTEPVPVNEYIDVATVGATNLAGYVFIVNELKDANGESVFYVLDPITPSYYGKRTAKRVELIGDISTGVAALTGMHPEMAMEFQQITEGKANYYARICGEYEEGLSTDTYLNCIARFGSATLASTNKYYTDITPGR